MGRSPCDLFSCSSLCSACKRNATGCLSRERQENVKTLLNVEHQLLELFASPLTGPLIFWSVGALPISLAIAITEHYDMIPIGGPMVLTTSLSGQPLVDISSVLTTCCTYPIVELSTEVDRLGPTTDRTEHDRSWQPITVDVYMSTAQDDLPATGRIVLTHDGSSP